MAHPLVRIEMQLAPDLSRFAKLKADRSWSAITYLSELTITIDEKEGSAVFDFEGTGPEMRGNLNAPVSSDLSFSQVYQGLLIDPSESDGYLRSNSRPDRGCLLCRHLLPKSDGRRGHPVEPGLLGSHHA